MSVRIAMSKKYIVKLDSRSLELLIQEYEKLTERVERLEKQFDVEMNEIVIDTENKLIELKNIVDSKDINVRHVEARLDKLERIVRKPETSRKLKPLDWEMKWRIDDDC